MAYAFGGMLNLTQPNPRSTLSKISEGNSLTTFWKTLLTDG